DLEETLRKRSEEIVRHRPGVNIRHAEGRQRVCAGLREKLHDAIGFIDKDLGVAHVSQPVVVPGNWVALPLHEPADGASYIPLAKDGSHIERQRLWVACQRPGHGRQERWQRRLLW